MKKHIALLTTLFVVGLFTFIAAKTFFAEESLSPQKVGDLMMRESKQTNSLLPTSITLPE